MPASSSPCSDPNGSGKSTLVKGMLGVVDRLGGEVEWFGEAGP